MVKKMISRLSVLVTIAVLLSACSKKTEYTLVIPADASATASINLKSLANKSGLKDKENKEAKQKMLDALKSGTTAATFQQLEKVLNNPNESGIDVEAPIYTFVSPSFPYMTILGKVSDIDKLRTSIDIMAKEQLCQPIEKADDYSYSIVGEDVILAFNESAAILVQVGNTNKMENARKSIATLMKQTPENSINKNAGFQSMQKQKGDVNFIASMAALPAEFSGQVSLGLAASRIDAKDLQVLGSLNFEKGKIAIQVEYYTENEEVKAQLKKQEKATKKLSTTFLKNFPASTVSFINVGANGAELYNLLLENEDFRNSVSVAKAAEVKELFTSFDGDISAGLINVTMDNAPTFAAYADVKNGNALKTIYQNKQALGLRRGEDIVKLGEDAYVYKSSAMNVFFGIQNKQMYATNDELLYKSIGKSVDKSIKDTPYAADMKGKNYFFVINMEAILELPVVQMMVGFGGEEYQMYYSLASNISYLEMSGEENKSEIDLMFKNKDINALKQIIDFAKQFAGM